MSAQFIFPDMTDSSLLPLARQSEDQLSPLQLLVETECHQKAHSSRTPEALQGTPQTGSAHASHRHPEGYRGRVPFSHTKEQGRPRSARAAACLEVVPHEFQPAPSYEVASRVPCLGPLSLAAFPGRAPCAARCDSVARRAGSVSKPDRAQILREIEVSSSSRASMGH